MYDGVTSAINAWVNGNTESVIEWLGQQEPHVVVLFCRLFIFDNPHTCGDYRQVEEQLNIICNRLQEKFAACREKNPQSYRDSA